MPGAWPTVFDIEEMDAVCQTLEHGGISFSGWPIKSDPIRGWKAHRGEKTTEGKTYLK